MPEFSLPVFANRIELAPIKGIIDKNPGREGRVGTTERIYKIERLLRSKGVVTIHALGEELEVSPATVRRDLDLLRDRLRSPIVYDRARRGWRIDQDAGSQPRHELPGLWFSGREIHGLLTFHYFLESLEPGLLAPHIGPLKERIRALLETKNDTFPEIARRVRILPQAARMIAPSCFEVVAHALLARKRLRLRLRYHGRARDAQTDRRISPQRLIHYRDNWYLDVWDHGKRALRIFSLDRIQEPNVLDEPAKEILDARLDRHFAQSYGIFAGRPRRNAVLKFNPARARWIANERWHPDQRGGFEDGHYILEFPYADDRELVLDILRYGADVEVLRPKSLQRRVLDQLLRAASQYRRRNRVITR